MKSSTKDTVKGNYHQVKGEIREFAGKVSNNLKLQAEGKGEKLAGIVQVKFGQVKKALGS